MGIVVIPCVPMQSEMELEGVLFMFWSSKLIVLTTYRLLENYLNKYILGLELGNSPPITGVVIRKSGF